MEGSPAPGIKNYLRRTRSLHQRVEEAEVIQSLVDHPGWLLMDDIVEDALARGKNDLAKSAESVALSTDPEKVTEFARKLGVQQGITLHRDVVASVLDSAKTAADELKKTAALDEAAERS